MVEIAVFTAVNLTRNVITIRKLNFWYFKRADYHTEDIPQGC